MLPAFRGFVDRPGVPCSRSASSAPAARASSSGSSGSCRRARPPIRKQRWVFPACFLSATRTGRRTQCTLVRDETAELGSTLHRARNGSSAIAAGSAISSRRSALSSTPEFRRRQPALGPIDWLCAARRHRRAGQRRRRPLPEGLALAGARREAERTRASSAGRSRSPAAYPRR